MELALEIAICLLAMDSPQLFPTSVKEKLAGPILLSASLLVKSWAGKYFQGEVKQTDNGKKIPARSKRIIPSHRSGLVPLERVTKEMFLLAYVLRDRQPVALAVPLLPQLADALYIVSL